MTEEQERDEKIETINDCFVGIRGDEVVLGALPYGSMDRAKALRLAAWLVAVADPLGDEFRKVYAAILKT